MACFLVPATEAVVVTVATQILIAHEAKVLPKFKREANASSTSAEEKVPSRRNSAGFPTCSGEARSCLRLSMFGMARSFRGSHS